MKELPPDVDIGDRGRSEDVVHVRGTKPISQADSRVGGGAGGIVSVGQESCVRYIESGLSNTKDISRDIVLNFGLFSRQREFLDVISELSGTIFWKI